MQATSWWWGWWRKSAPALPAASEADHEEKARRRLSADARGQIVPTLALWNHAARIGGGLTPADIANIIRDGDAGDTRRLVDLENECRQQDSHLQAVLGTNEESIAGLAYQIVAPTPQGVANPRSRDKRAAQWAEETLRSNPNIQALIAHLAGAYYHGFAVTEIVWRRDGGKIIPDRFVHVAPRRFIFRREDGALVLYDDGREEVDLQKEHPNKFIVAQPRVNGDVPNREGLGRPLVWMSVMRRWVIGDWIHTGETSWKPFILGKLVKEKAGATDRADLETIVRRLTTDFRAVGNDAMEIEIKWPEGSNTGRSTHAELCTMLANEMSKAVLGQTETTQASTSSGYAQAKVHDAVRRDLRETRARYISAVLTRDLLGPMIRMNFGEAVEVPRFEFVTQDPIDLKAFGEAIDKLVGAGAKIPVAWVNEQAGIPDAKDGEAVLVPPAKPSAATPDKNDDDKAGPGTGGKSPPTDPNAPDAVEGEPKDTK